MLRELELDLGELHQKQSDAFWTEATEVLYGGASGGGKSHLFRIISIYWCCQIPNLQVYLFRRTNPDLLHNHMEGPTSFPVLLADWVNNGLANINYSKSFIEFYNRSRITLCHCQHEKNVYNYQGAEIHVLIIDELTQWLYSMYVFLRSRLRLGGLNVPQKYKHVFPRIYLGANPGGVGHSWTKMTFIDYAKPFEMRKTAKEDGGLLRQYIPALLEDNPTLTENDPEYENRLEGLGSENLVKAMRYGIWDIVAGGAIDDLWRPQKHIIEPFDIPSTWKKDRGFDWGSSKPFAVCWFAESDGSEVKFKDGTTKTFSKGTVFLIAEYYGWNGKPNEGCKMLAVEIARKILEIEKNLPYKNIKPGPADSSIYDAENGVCIADDMARVGVKWTKADKSPGSRKTGLERFRKYFKASLKHPMEEPGLFIFDTCRHFIRTVPVLPRDEKNSDDVNSDTEDHIYDVCRYKLMQKKIETVFQSAMG